GRARARAGDQGRRAAGAAAARADLPQLRLHGREKLLALPQLPAAAQGPLPELRQAGRPSLGPLPLLRVEPRRRWREAAPQTQGPRRAPGSATAATPGTAAPP